MEPGGSLPDSGSPWGASEVFLLVPTETGPNPPDWEQLDRAARLKFLAREQSELDRQIRERLRGLEVEHLSGANSWVVRTPTPLTLLEMRETLRGLPVRVADDAQFTTFGG